MAECTQQFDFEISIAEVEKDYNVSFERFLQAQGGLQIANTVISSSPEITVVQSQVRNFNQDVLLVVTPTRIIDDAWVQVVARTNKSLPGGAVQHKDATIVFKIVERRTAQNVVA